MSDSLATALISLTLEDAAKGDREAWRFLTEPSEMLDLCCAHLECKSDQVRAMMVRLQMTSTPQEVQTLARRWRGRIRRSDITYAERKGHERAGWGRGRDAKGRFLPTTGRLDASK